MLAKYLSICNRKWRVCIIHSENMNAFVYANVPCVVFITTGLLNQVNAENGGIDTFAFVLAHELAHVFLEHTASKSYLLMLGLVIEILLLSFLEPTGVLRFVLEKYFGNV
mmetsp:Transcript_25928/g.57135  ORF Transcript_25928/g.57135 Transcript_25928/m.57135 type:complete len:110 (+) Transcript_25928:382-711(+)